MFSKHDIIKYVLFLIVFAMLGIIIFKQDNWNQSMRTGLNDTQRNLQLLTAGTSLDEKRLRKVLQVEKILNYQIPKKPQEQRHLLSLLIVNAAEKYPSFDHILFTALMSVENTKFDPKIISHAGAVGLTQFMPSSARKVCYKYNWTYTDSILFDQEKNIIFGADFLDECITLGGSVELGLVMYNGWEKQKNRYKLMLKKKRGESLDPEQEIELSLLSPESKNYPAKIFQKKKLFEKISSSVYVD